MNPAQHIAIFLVRVYQRVLSPLKTAVFGPMGECRFTPSCSHYAAQAVQIHGVLKGGALAGRRLCRCHPWGGCGEDPVPLKKLKIKNLQLKMPRTEERDGGGQAEAAAQVTGAVYAGRT